MPLLDAYIEDVLLETVVRSEVYITIRRDLANDPNRFGAGSAEDPFDGSKTSGGIYKLDTILRSIGPNTTIYFAPGTYETQGFKGQGAATGFWVKSGWRIIGGGWAGADSAQPAGGPAIFAMEGLVAGPNYLFSHGSGAGEEAEAFELGFVSINCNLTATPVSGYAAGAVSVNGSHIRIHDVRITDFGAIATSCDVVNIAQPSVDQPAAIDNVISGCVFDLPSGYSTGAVTCIRMTATPDSSVTPKIPYYHQACVIRKNFINCGLTNDFTQDYRGIGATGGRGIIVEQNEVWNCRAGFKPGPVAHPTLDLIVWDNSFYNVLEGISLEMVASSDGWTIDRAIIQSNLIELCNVPVSGTPMGIKADGGGASKLFKQLIIRKNQISHDEAQPGPPGSIGIALDSVIDAIVDYNLISVGADPANPSQANSLVRNSTVKNLKTFNNRTSAGVFLPCWNSSASLHDGDDLVTEVEDALIAV